MKPDHVKRFEESISYPEYTEEEKKKGMNNKDLDFMTDNIICLLYTSPSPRDRQKSRMPSSA